MSDKVKELIDIIKKEMLPHKVTAGPDYEVLSDDADGDISILMEIRIDAFGSDEGQITPEPVLIDFSYSDGEWLMIVGDDADELTVDARNLFAIMYFYSLQSDSEKARISDLERRNGELEEALREFTSGSTEAQYIENMENASCHAGLVSIEECGRCSRELKAIRALTRTKEQTHE